jgi:hypothetical protein
MSPNWVKDQLSQLGVSTAIGGREPVTMNRISHEVLVARLLKVREKLKWQLRLRVEKANHLPRTDLTGAADPYVTMETFYPFADDMQCQIQQKTRMIKNSLDPHWGEEFILDGSLARDGVGLESI